MIVPGPGLTGLDPRGVLLYQSGGGVPPEREREEERER